MTREDPASPTVVRAPNHLGDLVMALPALAAAGGADVQVVRWLAPLLEMVRQEDGTGVRRVLPLDRGSRGTLDAARELRRLRYARGILLTPSFSSALLFRLGGVRHRRGTPTDSRGPLLTDRVVLPSARVHRAALYAALVSGELPGRPPVPRLHVPAREASRWRELAGRADGPLVGVFPGSNAPSRRWDADRYAALVRRLDRRGVRVAVFGSPSERALTAEVAGGRALDLGGRTDLPLLAAGLAECALLVTNDSGPMHLAAAVGTPTLSLQGPGDPAVTRPLGDGQHMVRAGDLPCISCVRNVCPRSGPGYVLPDAHRECMRLIEVADVEAVVCARLPAGRAPARSP
ncbi:MAG TPA: glycosyltransferase family 9 protein [Longimicrobiaceae bacterium]|nr:glycosyltransferase family 9 protein [Longimicrobiaceae bacterium]